jgi:very-short-patch-repair endonuclease
MIDEIDDEDSPFVSISDEEYAEMQTKVQQAKALQSEIQQVSIQQAKLVDSNELDFHRLYTKARGWQSKFSVIRAAYNYYLPSILAAARTGHSINPNIVTWEFSPIEDNAWGQIRALGLPFYPQFPILDYFADFADPLRKIAIELDGKKFHDKKRDDIRDSRLHKEGWKIYRITGRIASRYLEDVFSEDIVYEIKEAVGSEYPFSIDNRSYLEMAEDTLDGYFLVLRRRHYT